MGYNTGTEKLIWVERGKYRFYMKIVYFVKYLLNRQYNPILLLQSNKSEEMEWE